MMHPQKIEVLVYCVILVGYFIFLVICHLLIMFAALFIYILCMMIIKLAVFAVFMLAGIYFFHEEISYYLG